MMTRSINRYCAVNRNFNWVDDSFSLKFSFQCSHKTHQYKSSVFRCSIFRIPLQNLPLLANPHHAAKTTA